MGIYGEFEAIGEICRNKYHQAQAYDRDFDARNYEWVLGCNVVDILRYGNEYYVIVHNNPTSLKELMGITVRIDYDLPNRISLYKEIK